MAPPHRPATLEELLVPGSRPRVIGHRGAAGLAPENTLPGFARALGLAVDGFGVDRFGVDGFGVDMVELDVQLSRDGELVVIHDAELDATTDGRGPVAERTLAELRRLDAGIRFSPAHAATRIPTLREVLEGVGREILVNVEIKAHAVTEEVAGGIEGKVASLTRELGLERRVIVSSFDPRALLHLRELAPEIATASLYEETLHRGMSPIEVMEAVGSRAFNLSKQQVDGAIVAHCHAHRRPVAVYTVNELDEMRALLDLGVDALFTDRPDRMLELLAVRADARER
ncbi:MAG TPA: glycerophosphodiester phosphodiesterase family protein [Thermoanaerobaculia bacterium]|nr:glycerophosphodiester phosphodiesterase family protein [Thermoanaerobaculia bacterium]